MKTFLAIFSGLLCSSLALAAPPHEVGLRERIEFAKPGGVPLLLDLHLPAGVENPPLVVWIHGGGWKGGSRKNCKIAWIAKHGYAVASIEYRLSQEAIFPAQVHDCKGAILGKLGEWLGVAEAVAVEGN